MQDASGITRANTPLRFIAAVSKPYKRFASGALLMAALASGAGALTPLVYKNIVDSISAQESHAIYLWVLAYIGLYIAGNMLWRVMSLFGARWSIGARHTGRMLLMRYALGHGHQYFEDRFTGGVANKLSQASDGSNNIINSIMFDFWPLLINFAVSLYLTLTTSGTLAGIFLAWLIVTIPVNYLMAVRRIESSLHLQKLETKVHSMTIDILGNVRAVREYARERHEMKTLCAAMQERRSASMHNWFQSEWMMGVNFLMQAAFMCALLVLSIHLAVIGAITYGSVVLVLSLIVGMAQSIFSLGQRISSLAEQWGEIQEGLQDILVAYDITDSSQAETLRVDFGSVAFTHASFAYEGSEQVLKNFSLSIAPTEKVGIVGRSGAGKSTLIKLLLRHYDLAEGAVLVDGQDIRDTTQESLRAAIAAVPQEPLLFHRTIRENIAYGKPDAAMEEILDAAKLAHAHEFIKRLPLGYETMVGERGVTLSGGERQRVAIARAILKPAKILVLDEATSALDSESEAAIQEALEKLMDGKTVIAIAHRLSTLRQMDRILVFEHGEIVEDGTHEELISAGGLYAELWARQSGGYLVEGATQGTKKRLNKTPVLGIV